VYKKIVFLMMGTLKNYGYTAGFLLRKKEGTLK